MSANAHHCWAVVTSDESKADKVFAQVSKEQKEKNIDFIQIREGKDHAEIVYKDDVSIRWIKPIANFKGFRFHRLWCDKDIDKKYLEQVILPMACYMRHEDIVWI